MRASPPADLRSGSAAGVAVATACVAVLALLPLTGLVVALVDPPPDPFGGAERGLLDVVRAARTGTLLLTSLALACVVALGASAWGMALAWLEHRADYPGRNALGTLSLLPLAMPSYVLAATVATALGPAGWIGGPLGLSRPSGFWLAALVLVVVTTPFVQLVVGAALKRSSAAEEEAARTLGAGRWRVFRTIVLPRLRPALAYSGLIALLYAISDFGAVAVLDVPVLTWRLYDAVRDQDVARAAVLGLAVLVATLPLFLAARWVRGGAGTRGQGTANPRPPAPQRLGGVGTATAWLLHLSIVGLGVVVPVATMVGWVLSGMDQGRAFASPWAAVWDTVVLAALGTVLTLVMALPPAWITARRRTRLGPWLEQATYLTSALPGVLVALGLMQAALAVARALGPTQSASAYQAMLSSGLLLFLGYGARYIAEVFSPLQTAALQLDARQEEAARVLGAPRLRWWTRVVAPAVTPGVAVAVLVGFVAIAKELPVTLLLGGATGRSTLAFRVWDRYSESLWHDAGLSGLLLVALTLVVVGITLPWRRHA